MLSREITSCGGTLNTIVRRSTRTACCSTGQTTIRPGPFTRQKRPSWNTTERSYSRMMRNDQNTTIRTTTRMTVPKLRANIFFQAPCLAARLGNDVELQAFDARDANALARLERRRAADAPGLAVHARPALALAVGDHHA